MKNLRKPQWYFSQVSDATVLMRLHPCLLHCFWSVAHYSTTYRRHGFRQWRVYGKLEKWKQFSTPTVLCFLQEAVNTGVNMLFSIEGLWYLHMITPSIEFGMQNTHQHAPTYWSMLQTMLIQVSWCPTRLCCQNETQSRSTFWATVVQCKLLFKSRTRLSANPLSSYYCVETIQTKLQMPFHFSTSLRTLQICTMHVGLIDFFLHFFF